ncbi:MAG: hypothetical protein FWG72_00060 [Oscillospiraceae bacterium]|nr:hypothetical protein [Oscillospiraceae bacterium]
MKTMKLSGAARKMIPVILTGALIAAAAGFAVWFFVYGDAGGGMLFVAGVFWAAAFNVLKVRMIDRMVKNTVEMTDPNAGRTYFRGQSVIRLFFTAGVLAAAHYIPFLDLLGACVGILTFQFAAYSLKFRKIGDDEEEGDNP